jgi:SRSO17 transposase
MSRAASSPEGRFAEFVTQLGAVIGHADRHDPLRGYLMGLLLPGERKSVEPMAARLDPRRTGARHQSLHHFVANAGWDADEVIRVARDHALRQLERHAPVGAWIIDDTGMPKKGRFSVGVGRQYCGQLGKQDNCQVAVAISAANSAMSVPCAYRLYLPESWTDDPERRAAAGIPKSVRFQPKWSLAISLLDSLLADDLPRAPVVADAGYGATTAFRDAVTACGLSYAVGVTAATSAWPPGEAPLPPVRRLSGRGRQPRRVRRTPEHQPVPLHVLARSLPKKAWQTVRWREGTRGTMTSRFTALRVRPAHRDDTRTEPRPVEWLLIEWPTGEQEPTKYWLSTVPEDVELDELVRLAKLRWRVERDFQELKDEIGLDHYEGRSWRGFHHHGALCIAAYAFLAAERARLSPPEAVAFLRAAPLPKGFKPRGSPGAA